jgi:YidC/Oxa1 family membrane protein insertase
VIVAASSPLKPIEDLLTWALEHIHSIGLTWAWSIVVLTIIVRILLVPLVVKQIHSMQSLQRHAPEMKAIQQRYKGDRAKMNEELMKFYKENSINPASSCLPTLFQIPIFFSLYFVLRDFEREVIGQSGESLSWMRLVPDITAGITDHWSGYLLLVVYVVSQVSSTYFMATTADRTQRIMFMVLPVVFVPFIINPPGKTVFPVGLLMYWMTTNLWVVGQGLMTRRLIPRAPAAPPKKSSRTPPRGGDGGGDGAKPAKPAPRPAAGAAAGPRKVKRKKKQSRR